MSGAEQVSVYKALANPVRRRILDLLRDGPLRTGDIASRFDDLSRFAVMQHLGVLTGAGIVVVRRTGRDRWNHLNPVPIREIYERWVSAFAEDRARALLALRRHVEEGGGDMTEGRKVTIEAELRLKAPCDRVWRAINDEQMDWYPHSYGRDRLKRIVTEPHVGGRVYEDWGDDAGHLYSTITHWDPPRALGTRGALYGGIVLEHWFELEADGDETVLRQTTITFGAIDDEMAEGIRQHGDLGRYEDSLRAWVERGERVPA